jgi:hypothetical protein
VVAQSDAAYDRITKSWSVLLGLLVQWGFFGNVSGSRVHSGLTAKKESAMSASEHELAITYIGGATVILMIDGVTFVTDPTFDPAGESESSFSQAFKRFHRMPPGYFRRAET